MKQGQSDMRLNYSPACEDLVNKQIHMEFTAFYAYTCMAYHFSRPDVALLGFHKFFMKMAEEEKGHAHMLMDFQNKRGGRVVLADVKCLFQPKAESSLTTLSAMEEALKMEKDVYQKLMTLRSKALEDDDVTLSCLSERMLEEQISSISEITSFITQIRTITANTADFLMDKTFLEKY